MLGEHHVGPISLRPLPWLSPVPLLMAHSREPEGRRAAFRWQRQDVSGTGRCALKPRLCQQSCAPEPGPAGKARRLQEVKTCPCVYFCWLPHCIIICQHVRCGFICALKTARSGWMQTLYSTLGNAPAAEKRPLQIFHPFNKCI